MVAWRRAKSPQVLVQDVAKRYGGTRDGDGWRMPDGAFFHVPSRMHWTGAYATVRQITDRYELVQRAYVPGSSRPGKPAMRLDRLVVSSHAKQRWAEMRVQRELDESAILHALRLPLRVVWSDVHSSWVWVGEDVAVPVVEVADGLLVKTVLWATRELWDEHPRAEKQ